MLPYKIKELTIPLSPYLQSGQRKILPTKRIRPVDSLNLKKLVKEINKSDIITLDINGKPWSVVSVYSSYSPDVHIMLVETSSNRYLPGPERIPDSEGNDLMAVGAAILEFIIDRKTNVSIHFGYNWSPRSWGQQEEKTGFQSIPTKWHPHLWGWPSLDNIKATEQKYVRLIKPKSLSRRERRLLGDNDYSEPFGLLIRNELKKTFHKNSLLFKLFPHKNWQIDGCALYAVSSLSILDILGRREFFSRVLKPLAVLLEYLTRDITEIITDMKCRDIDRILVKTEKGCPKGWKALRNRTVMQPRDYISRQFEKRGYPKSFLNAIFDAVKNRCNEQGNPQDWWRKGFGYAVVFSGYSGGGCGEIRIMPGVYVGPGGVVEAQGVVLRRPEDKQLSQIEISEKSKVFRHLAGYLKSRGFREYMKDNRQLCK